MNTTIDGVDYRIGFRHKQKFEEGADGKRRPQPFPLLPKVRQARAHTQCYVAQLEPPVAEGQLRQVHVIAGGEAVCSWSDHFDKEFARQVSLARALAQLPGNLVGRLLGSYLRSAKDRPIADLSTVKIRFGLKVKPAKTLAQVAKMCQKENP